MTFGNILNKLARVPGQKFIPEIDGLRFFSIVSVVLLHLRTHFLRESPIKWDDVSLQNNVLYAITSKGGAGVHIFFAISGFILAVPFARQYIFENKIVVLSSYYKRRLTRLEPPFIISLFLITFSHLYFLNAKWDSLSPHFFSTLGYVHFVIYGKGSIINPVTWSLETEVQFYILAPIFFLIFKIKKYNIRLLFKIILSLFTLIPVYFYLINLNKYHLDNSILIYINYFMVGIFFADYYLKYIADKLIEKSYIFDVVGIISIYLIFLVHYNPGMKMTEIILKQCISTYFLMISIFRGTILNYIFSRKLITVIGGMCYTIYLIHYPVLAFILKFTSNIHFTKSFTYNYIIQCSIVIPLLLIICSVFFLLFEKPFMAVKWSSHRTNSN